jgi:hypothetical protein
MSLGAGRYLQAAVQADISAAKADTRVSLTVLYLLSVIGHNSGQDTVCAVPAGCWGAVLPSRAIQHLPSR